jgi:hypothetical protein
MLNRVLGVVILGAATFAGAEVPASITATEYALYMDWKEGALDPRLAHLNHTDKLNTLAKSLGVTVGTLEKAIEKGVQQAPSLAQNASQKIRQSIQRAEVGGRLLDVEVDTSHGHVVAGVQWRCADLRDADKDASYIAWGVAQAEPLVQTLALWCVDASGTKQFSAKIARSAMEKIQVESVERFASSRLIRLFETVQRGPHE